MSATARPSGPAHTVRRTGHFTNCSRKCSSLRTSGMIGLRKWDEWKPLFMFERKEDVCVHACVCVCEREREKGEREGGRMHAWGSK